MQIIIGICQPYIFLFLITISNWIYFSLASSLHPPSTFGFPYGAHSQDRKTIGITQLSVFYWLLQTTLENWIPWPLTSLFLVSEMESLTDEARLKNCKHLDAKVVEAPSRADLCIVCSCHLFDFQALDLAQKFKKEAGDFKIKKGIFCF